MKLKLKLEAKHSKLDIISTGILLETKIGKLNPHTDTPTWFWEKQFCLMNNLKEMMFDALHVTLVY